MSKRRRGFPIIPVGIGLGVVLVGAGFYVIGHTTRVKNVAEASMWAATGEPCLTLNQAEYHAQNMPLPHSFDYQGLTLARAFGQAECTDVHDDGGKGKNTHKVCTFTAPGIVKATIEGQDHYFQAKYAKPVTLSYEAGKFACVLAKPAGVSG